LKIGVTRAILGGSVRRRPGGREKKEGKLKRPQGKERRESARRSKGVSEMPSTESSARLDLPGRRTEGGETGLLAREGESVGKAS